MSRPSNLSLQQLWLCETIRLREQQAGALEDEAINRQVRAEGGDLDWRVAARALLLARRDGQWQALRHWLQGARLALAALLLLALMSGFGLGVAALGDGLRPVNVFWALSSLLGVNWLLLLGWALAQPASAEPSSLGRLWLWLSARFARDVQAAQLAPALLHLLQRQTRWAFGVLSHALWSLVMLAALVALLALLATRRYGFVWESTLLHGDTFVTLTHVLGALPALFGFSVPDVDLILASGNALRLDAVAQRIWAGWLVGVVLVYGLMPRLLLTLFCGWRLRRGIAGLRLDIDDPGYQMLAVRLMPTSERLGADGREPVALFQPQVARHPNGAQGALLLGVELDPRQPWPPAAVPVGVIDGGVVDTRAQRRYILDMLSAAPVQRLLLVCDPRRSPDRGTLALLSELAGYATACRIWLRAAYASTPDAADEMRLQAWREALQRAGLEPGDDAAWTWLERGDG